MKKLLGLVILVCSLQPLFAANLNIKVAGTNKENRYFLCLNGHGCMSMYASAHGRTFPVDDAAIETISVVNAQNLQVSSQVMPASCKMNLSENKTVTVSGKISQRANGTVQISNLNCRVS